MAPELYSASLDTEQKMSEDAVIVEVAKFRTISDESR